MRSRRRDENMFSNAHLPVPLKLTTCGLFAALSWRVSVPLRVPVAVGLKVTLMPHVACAAKLVPQVLVSAKSPATAIPAIVTAVPPVLVTLKVFGELVVPTF